MSTLKVTNIQDTAGGNSSTSAEIYSGRCKAWVNFDGTGTVAIRASFNVSSITDNTTGDYTVNFSNAMTDANYIITGSSTPDLGVANQGYRWLAVGTSIHSNFSKTSSSARVQVVYDPTNRTDGTHVSVAVFR